jgi:hypothetical protein
MRFSVPPIPYPGMEIEYYMDEKRDSIDRKGKKPLFRKCISPSGAIFLSATSAIGNLNRRECEAVSLGRKK